MKNLLIERVCGRVQEDLSSAPDEAVPSSAASPIPEPGRQSRVDYDEETGQLPADGRMPDESVVDDLISAWNSGQRNEVAAQILFTPVSYADFARFVYAIGQDNAVQLGLMLDEMAESEGIGQDAGRERVLSRAAGEGESPSETLPEPPVEEPEMPIR